MTYLLDVNVLIALIDPAHVHHNQAHSWFERFGHSAWATCPITQNGVLRIVGNPRYPNSPGTPYAVADLIAVFLNHPGHQFWPDSVSLFDREWIRAARLINSSQVTDGYLLALAAANKGMLATFVQRLMANLVAEGHVHLHII